MSFEAWLTVGLFWYLLGFVGAFVVALFGGAPQKGRIFFAVFWPMAVPVLGLGSMIALFSDEKLWIKIRDAVE